jgi:adenosylhomocysteine nucleosidase
MSSGKPVVAVTCLALEARIALGPGVFVICTQASRLVSALDAAIKRGASGIISFGIAGGLAPNLVAGDWIVGSTIRHGRELYQTDRVWTQSILEAIPGAVRADIVGTDAIIAEPSEKRRLHTETGAAAVDMESHVAARIAAAHRIPFTSCRVIMDAAHKILPPAAMVELHHDGTPNVLGVLSSVFKQPSQLSALAHTALDTCIALAALRRGRHSLGPQFAFPQNHIMESLQPRGRMDAVCIGARA